MGQGSLRIYRKGKKAVGLQKFKIPLSKLLLPDLVEVALVIRPLLPEHYWDIKHTDMMLINLIKGKKKRNI